MGMHNAHIILVHIGKMISLTRVEQQWTATKTKQKMGWILLLFERRNTALRFSV